MSERVEREGYESHDGSGSDTSANPEGLTEHKDGESAGDWLKNDVEQTKEDLHIGNKD